MARFPFIPKQAYWLIRGKDPQFPSVTHIFCGKHDLPGAVSPNTGRPLIQVLSLDLSDPRLELTSAPVPRLPLLMSFTCGIIADAPFLYRVFGDRVEILRHGTRDQGPDFPYPDYPDYFAPQRMMLSPVPAHIREAIEWGELSQSEDEAEYQKYEPILNGLWLRSDLRQVGGVPLGVQLISTWDCPHCTARMPIVAAISDDCTDPRGFTHNIGSQAVFAYCPHCSIVGAVVECD
jgi:hypothetical protein